jgi:hypothetical protein
MERGKGQLHLRLHANRAKHQRTRRRLGRVVKQRRLPNPRLPSEHEHAAPPHADAFEQPIEHGTLVSPTTQ